MCVEGSRIKIEHYFSDLILDPFDVQRFPLDAHLVGAQLPHADQHHRAGLGVEGEAGVLHVAAQLQHQTSLEGEHKVRLIPSPRVEKAEGFV